MCRQEATTQPRCPTFSSQSKIFPVPGSITIKCYKIYNTTSNIHSANVDLLSIFIQHAIALHTKRPPKIVHPLFSLPFPRFSNRAARPLFRKDEAFLHGPWTAAPPQATHPSFHCGPANLPLLQAPRTTSRCNMSEEVTELAKGTTATETISPDRLPAIEVHIRTVVRASYWRGGAQATTDIASSN